MYMPLVHFCDGTYLFIPFFSCYNITTIYIYMCVCVCVSKLILSGYSSRSKGRDDNIESELIYTEDSGAGRNERL
jgi:hypothetical protein